MTKRSNHSHTTIADTANDTTTSVTYVHLPPTSSLPLARGTIQGRPKERNERVHTVHCHTEPRQSGGSAIVRVGGKPLGAGPAKSKLRVNPQRSPAINTVTVHPPQQRPVVKGTPPEGQVPPPLHPAEDLGKPTMWQHRQAQKVKKGYALKHARSAGGGEVKHSTLDIALAPVQANQLRDVRRDIIVERRVGHILTVCGHRQERLDLATHSFVLPIHRMARLSHQL